MITVAHIITRLELGGAQENTLDTVAGLDRSRFNVALLYGPGGTLDRRLPDLARTTELIAVPELVRDISPRTDALCVSALRQHLWRLQAQHWRKHPARSFVVHTHCSKAGILGRSAARAAEAPHVVHTIHGFGFHPGQSKMKHALFVNAERLAARVTDTFIGVSQANLTEARTRGIIRSNHRVELIRSGMDLGELRRAQSTRAEKRKELHLGPEAEVILCIGNFKPQKDPLTLIRAMPAVLRDRKQAVLLYAGDGDLRPDVEREIERLGISDNVRLLGWRDDIYELLAACDIVALSSIFEGLPRSAVQAVAARRPFVGTRVDGTPEIIRDGKNGFLVAPRSPSLMAKAINKALVLRPIDPEDEGLIAAWDVRRMVEQQEALYESMTSS